MEIIPEPFLSRETILSVYRPGEVTTERPFRTLRERHAASEGLSVRIRTLAGQVLGRIQLYCSLNADAARAYRLHQKELALALAEQAGRIEQSPQARVIQQAVAAVASRMPLDPTSSEAPTALRRYLGLRRHSSWRGLDRGGLARDWLIHSAAWFQVADDHRGLRDAITTLDQAVSEVRRDLLTDQQASVTTFFGVVKRMDSVAAELESADGEVVLIPREELQRQGLAALWQPVALLCEVLPGGGSYNLALPAVALDAPRPEDIGPVWETEFDESGAIPVDVLSGRDVSWLDRELARNPTAIPVGPLRVR